MIAEYRRRRDVLVRGLDEIPGICGPTPKGAFYAFPNVKGLFSNGVQNTTDLAAHLVEEAGVVTVPGAAFGRDEHLRFSYATSMEQIERGLDRLHALFR
jgi:aspartate aminotransferase